MSTAEERLKARAIVELEESFPAFDMEESEPMAEPLDAKDASPVPPVPRGNFADHVAHIRQLSRNYPRASSSSSSASIMWREDTEDSDFELSTREFEGVSKKRRSPDTPTPTHQQYSKVLKTMDEQSEGVRHKAFATLGALGALSKDTLSLVLDFALGHIEDIHNIGLTCQILRSYCNVQMPGYEGVNRRYFNLPMPAIARTMTYLICKPRSRAERKRALRISTPTPSTAIHGNHMLNPPAGEIADMYLKYIVSLEWITPELVKRETSFDRSYRRKRKRKEQVDIRWATLQDLLYEIFCYIPKFLRKVVPTMDHDAREASNAIMVALILPSYEALVKEHNDEPAELGLMLVNYACGGDNNNFHAAHKGFLGSIVEIPFLVATLKELLNILTSTGERLCEDEERDCPPESIDADELFR